MRKEFKNSGKVDSAFWQWIESCQEYDFCLRGLRALRHFTAHIEVKQAPSVVRLAIGGSRPYGTSNTTASREWQLPTLGAAAVQKLETGRLSEAMLADWNKLASTTPAAAVFDRGIRQIAAILTSAETEI